MSSPETGAVLQLAVQMTCESCAAEIKAAVEPLGAQVKCDVAANSVIVEGDVAPSAIVDAISATGRDAIVRGSGAPNSAAVCILEDLNGKPEGLVRIAQTSPTAAVLDISVSKSVLERLGPNLWLTAQEFGDISRGALSTGRSTDRIVAIEGPTSYTRHQLTVKSLIGRSLVLGPDPITSNSLVGIVARSAGAWELDKSVCSCTGRTMWQEPRLS